MKRTGYIALGLAILMSLLLFLGTAGLCEERLSKLTKEEEGFICPAWSPDGRLIAMTDESWSGIWTVWADGTRLRRLVEDQGAGYRFAWSPDGRHIAYRAERMEAGRKYFAIRIVNVETRHIEEITEFQRFLGTPRWVMEDGTIVFETDRKGTLAQAQVVGLVSSSNPGEAPYWVAITSRDLEIWVSDPYGGERTLISGPDERCFDPVLSPQGDWVCYTVLDHGGSIAVAAVDGSSRQNLGFGSNPAWSPDGQHLVYEVTQDDGHVITGSDLFIIKFDGTRCIQLTDTSVLFERWPSWSPDGSRIAFSAAGAIYTIPVPSDALYQKEEAP